MTVAEKKQQLADYKASLAGKTFEELKELEQQLIKEADEVDAKVKDTTFELPAENYKIVAEAIRLILNKISVQWQFTLGLVSMYDFWNPEKREKTIPYPMLDSTLRTLGEQQFKGYEEWAAVVAVNKYFEPLHKGYVDTTELVYDVAAKHNEVMDAMKALNPGATVEIPDAVNVG